MNLYQEIMAKILAQEEIHIVFPNLSLRATELIELKCYQALKQIKTILETESLSDETCFFQIEEIVRVLEHLGSGAGSRHD